MSCVGTRKSRSAEIIGASKPPGRQRSAAAVAGSVCLALALAACASQGNTPGVGLANGAAGSLNGGGGPVNPGTQRDFSVNVGNTVYFTTDSSNLTPEAERTLRAQANWLNRYPRYTITLEGHADERGTREYNIALGARRATTVRRFLSQTGVNPSRLRTISYGKERPVAVCDDISCWSQNRRSVTVLNKPAGS
ncbi:MAG: peptidoglycan-associated lipoprotein Pal [Pseudomonadota bacterium]